MSIHVTSEMGDINIGGVGTVIDELYQVRTEGDYFVVVSDKPQVFANSKLRSMQNVILLSLSDYLKYDLSQLGRTVYFHNYFLFQKNKNCQNIFVCHSILSVEKKIDPQSVSGHALEFQMRAFREADHVVFVSHFDQKLAYKEWATDSSLNPEDKSILLHKKTSVIYNGVRAIQKKDTSKLQKKQSEHWTFGYIGRITKRKGVFDLIRAFPQQDLLLIAGGGVERISHHGVNEFILSLNSRGEKNILPVGYCNEQRKQDFFNSIDALIVPSLYEPFGMTILESLNQGVPVICTRSGGPLEILDSNYSYFYDSNISGDLERVISLFKTQYFAEYEVFQRQMGSVIQKFSSMQMAEQYRNTKSKLIKSE